MDSQALKIWRRTLLFVLAGECCIQTGSAYWQATFRSESPPGLYGMMTSSLPLMLLLAVGTITALWHFLGPAASLVAGLAALTGMKIAAEVFERVFTAHHQDFYQGGALLTGVVIGELYARMTGLMPDRGPSEYWEARRFGMTGALGMLAGSYIAAGTSKLMAGGLHWASSSTVRLMILAHGEVEGSVWSRGIPEWTANHASVCMMLELGTLIVQLGAFMLIVGPRARRLWSTLIVAFHLGIYLTSHILFVTPMVFAAAVAVPWHYLLPGEMDVEKESGERTFESMPRNTHPALLALTAFSGVVLLRLATGW